MSAEYRLADAFRTVALRLEQVIESGHCANHIDAEDLRETLLAVADLFDAPVAVRARPAVNTTPEGTLFKRTHAFWER